MWRSAGEQGELIGLTEAVNGGHRHGGPREEREGRGVVPVGDHVPVCLVRGCDGLKDLQDEKAVDCT